MRKVFVLLVGLMVLAMLSSLPSIVSAEPCVPIDESTLSPDEKNAFLYVKDYAEEQGLSPALIMAIIKQESNFNPNVVGDRGLAIGYMQLHWDAAYDAGYRSARGDSRGYAKKDWPTDGLDPDTNIEYGCGYLKICYDKHKDSSVYDNPFKNAVSAYNLGWPRGPHKRNENSYVNPIIQNYEAYGECPEDLWCEDGECVPEASTNCDENEDCKAYLMSVNSFCLLYPDACGIYTNSLWDGPRKNHMSFEHDSRLANKIRNSHLWSSHEFKENIISEVKSQLEQNIRDIKCIPVNSEIEVEIFKDNKEIITSGEFKKNNLELFLIFKAFDVLPHGTNQINLKRVGENDYKVSGTIKLRLNDTFDFGPENKPKFMYGCQQAGCIHNFGIDVYGIDFEIKNLELTLDSSEMYCEEDAEEIKCCLEGCVNTSTDPKNCGWCGNECPEDQWCEEGDCVPEASTFVVIAVGLLFLAGYVRLLKRKPK